MIFNPQIPSKSEQRIIIRRFVICPFALFRFRVNDLTS